jgi:hypothetical protein
MYCSFAGVSTVSRLLAREPRSKIAYARLLTGFTLEWVGFERPGSTLSNGAGRYCLAVVKRILRQVHYYHVTAAFKLPARSDEIFKG